MNKPASTHTVTDLIPQLRGEECNLVLNALWARYSDDLRRVARHMLTDHKSGWVTAEDAVGDGLVAFGRRARVSDEYFATLTDRVSVRFKLMTAVRDRARDLRHQRVAARRRHAASPMTLNAEPASDGPNPEEKLIAAEAQRRLREELGEEAFQAGMLNLQDTPIKVIAVKLGLSPRTVYRRIIAFDAAVETYWRRSHGQ